MNTKSLTIIGLLGSVIDAGHDEDRWNKWRPTVSVCQHKDMPVERLELMFSPQFLALAKQLQEDIGVISPNTLVQLHTLNFKDPWDFEEVYDELYGFIKMYKFAPENEDYLVHISTGPHVVQICEYLLTESRHIPGKLLQSSPPKEKGSAPGYRIIDLELSRYDRIASRFQTEKVEGLTLLKSGIATKNRHFNTLIEQIELVAIHSTDPIILMGPTGAGKSLLAKRIFELKKIRRQVKGPLKEVNCAVLKGDLSISTLFGHKKGAFTGATEDRAGLLLAANSGVLFLDEIGELGTDEQAMLLRALEEKKFLPMGSDTEENSDFQLIAGTNRDLFDEVDKGNFRKDLLARINIWPFFLPGLTDRKEDIEPNLDYELKQLTRQTDKKVRFNKEARRLFLEFALSNDATWDGNFRDLNVAVRRMGMFSHTHEGRITVELVKDEIIRLKQSWRKKTVNSENQNLERLFTKNKLSTIDLVDQLLLRAILPICNSSKNMAEAGRILYSHSRTQRKQTNDTDRLSKLLKKFGLTWNTIQRIDSE